MANCEYCGGAGCKVCASLIRKKEQEPKSKYKNKKTEVDGFKFDSIAEGKFYAMLKVLKQTEAIHDFELQPKFEIFPGYTIAGKKVRAIYYIGDFKIMHNDGTFEVVDVKGVETEAFKLKKKMFLYHYGNEYSLSVMAECPKKYGDGFIELAKLQEIRKIEKGDGINGGSRTKAKPKSTGTAKKKETKQAAKRKGKSSKGGNI